jgi:hypothetical protein
MIEEKEVRKEQDFRDSISHPHLTSPLKGEGWREGGLQNDKTRNS